MKDAKFVEREPTVFSIEELTKFLIIAPSSVGGVSRNSTFERRAEGGDGESGMGRLKLR